MASYGRGEDEVSRPLLEAHRGADNVLFAAEGGEEDYEDSALRKSVDSSKEVASPSFGPPLRSTVQSREARRQLEHMNITPRLITFYSS